MAASKKKRVVEMDDGQEEEPSDVSDDDNDSEDDDSEEPMEQQIEMDFEARTPEDSDFNGMRTLLQQVFLKANIDISELTNTIISQNYVGSIVKYYNVEQCLEDLVHHVHFQAEKAFGRKGSGTFPSKYEQPYVPDDDEEDEGDAEDETVLAMTTVINMTERKDLNCVKQIKGMLMEKCKQCGKDQFEAFNKLLNDPDHHVGYLINERFLNLPPNMALPLFESLIKEMEKARTKNMKYDFAYFLMIIKTFMMASSTPSKPEMYFTNSEEELFQEKCTLSFRYSVAHERDKAVQKWSSDDGMEPYRTVLVIPADKLQSVVDKLRDELAST